MSGCTSDMRNEIRGSILISPAQGTEIVTEMFFSYSSHTCHFSCSRIQCFRSNGIGLVCSKSSCDHSVKTNSTRLPQTASDLRNFLCVSGPRLFRPLWLHSDSTGVDCPLRPPHKTRVSMKALVPRDIAFAGADTDDV